MPIKAKARQVMDMDTVYDKDYQKGRVAVDALAEKLGVSFERRTIAECLPLIKEALEGKSFGELLATGSEGATASLLSVVWNAAVPALIGRQAVQVMRDVKPSIRVPKAAKAKAYLVGQSGGAPITAEAYSYKEIIARLWECIPVVPRVLVEDCSWDVIERQMAEGARALAEEETGEIVLGLIAGAATANNVTFSSPMEYANEIAEAAGKVEAAGWEANTIIVHPTNYWQLMKETNLISWQVTAQAPPAIITGKIPTIAGMQLLKSTKCTVNNALVLDKFNAGVLYVRRDITLENYADPIKDLAGAVLTSRFRFGIIRDTAISKIA